MENEFDQSTMRKASFVLAVVFLSGLAGWFFWRQKHYGTNYPLESQNINQENPQKELTEEEIEKQKTDKMYALLGQGYVWAIHGQIKSIDLEKGIMEIETEQTKEKKTFEVLLDGKTKVVRITPAEVPDQGKNSRKNEEDFFEVKEEQIKLDASTLQLGMSVEVKSPEMFLAGEENSIKAERIIFFKE